MARTLRTRTALYRFYDAHGMLLYVGITDRPGRRWQEHMERKPWYPQVRHQAATWYGSEPEARRAETRAIRAEHPKFNVVGAIRPAGWRFDLRDQPLWEYAAILLCIPGAYFGIARLVPAVTPLARLSLLVVPVLVIAIVAIRGTQLARRCVWWLQRFSAPSRKGADFDASTQALSILAAEPDISGAKLAERVGMSERWGQNFKKNLAASAASPNGHNPEE